MSPVLAPVAAALATLRAVDAAGIGDLAAVVAELCRLLDGFEAERARFVHEAERVGVWARSGATSPEAWLAQTTGSTRRAAAERMQLASTLAAAPVLADAVSAGRVSPDTARVLTPAVTTGSFASDGDRLVDAVAGLRPAQATRARDEWLAAHEPSRQADHEAQLAARRSASFAEPGADGLGTLTVTLGPVPLRIVRNALDHLVDGQRHDRTERTRPQRYADALVELCDAYAKGTVTGGRARPALLVSVGYRTLFGGSNRPARLATGETITAAEARRLALDANLHRVVTGPASEIIDYGRARRLASHSQYQALVLRDQGCRWPGCDRPPGWCEVDHLDDWTPKQGDTDLDRLVLFCSRHHHQRHQPGHRLHGDALRLVIELPSGERLCSVVPKNDLDEPLDEVTPRAAAERVRTGRAGGAAPRDNRPRIARELALALGSADPP